MRLNLSSEIVLNKVPLAYYKPKTNLQNGENSYRHLRLFHGGCSSRS